MDLLTNVSISVAFIIVDENEFYLSTAALIMYNLKQYDDSKSYFENALKLNVNLTSLLSEKELLAFKKVMNSEDEE